MKKYRYYQKRPGGWSQKLASYSTSLVLLFNSMGIALPFVLTQRVFAATTQVVYASTPGWTTGDTRSDGYVDFVHDSGAPLGSGALSLRTGSTLGQDKAQYINTTTYDVALSAISELSYDTKTNHTTRNASFQLYTDLDNNGSVDTTLVYETYYNGGNTPDAWSSWDLMTGKFWPTNNFGAFTDGTADSSGAGGYATNFTLAQVVADATYADARIRGFGLNLGSYNPDTVSLVDKLNFNGTIYNFEPTPVTPELNAENFNTVDEPTYKGISVGFNAKNFGTVTAVEVELERADGSTVTKHGNQGVFDIISGATTSQQLTAPFVIEEGSFTEASDALYWDPAPAAWDTTTTPVKATIRVTDENGTKTVVNTNFSQGNPSWPTYESLLPPPSLTEVVTGNTAAGENQPGWMFNRDASTSTPFEFSTAQASIGGSSLYVKPIGATPSNKFVAEYFALEDITGVRKFSYDFRIGAGGDATDANQFYLNVYANFGSSSATKFYDCRYNVIPTSGSTSSWTTVVFDPAQAYPVTTSGSSPHACPASPAAMESLSSGSTIRAFAINAGDTSASDTGLDGYLDKVVYRTASAITTYDFEYVPAPSASTFITSPKYTRENNASDVAAQVRVPSQTSAVRFTFSGPTTVNNVAGYEHLQTGQWPNAGGEKQYRVAAALPAGTYSVTAEFNAGGIWYPVSNGPATLYVLANPTFDFVTPNDSRHIFRPGDTAIVRIRAQDANNSFNRVDFKIGSTTYTVNRAACDLREAGNYVICDINAAGNWSPLTAGTYTASAKVYNTANGNTTKTSRSFDIDDQEPTVSNFVVPALVSSTLSVSVDATDNYSIDKVTFWLAEPATGGVCKNNLPALLTAIGTPSGNTYSASFDTSSLNGPYCVLVSARDISAHNTTPLFKSTLIDNTAPDVPILLSPGNNSAQNFNNFWFDWTDVVDAVSYEVQFSQSNSTDSNGALNVGVWSGDASHNQPTESRAWSSGANGTWYWQVRAVDAAGNKSVWTSTWKMTIDMVAPDVPTASLSQDSNGANVPNGGTTNSQYFTFTLGSSTDTIRYQLRYWNDIPGSPFKAGSPWNPTDLAGYSPTLGIYKDNFTQGDGIHYFSFSACDAAGSCSAYGAPFVVTYDSTAPVLTINSLLSTTNTSPTFTGTTTDPGAPVILTVDSVDHAAMVNPDGTWSATVTGPLTPGSYTAVASSTDASGNASTPANQPFTVTAAVAGVSTNTPSSNTNTNDSGATGANTAGTTTKKKTIVVTSTDSNGEVLAAETTQDAAANTDAQIEEDMSNARSGALGSTTNTQEDGTASTSCSKVLGLCWYYWIPVIVIALVIMGIIYGNRRDRISTV